MYGATLLSVLFSVDVAEVFHVFIKPFDIVHFVVKWAICWKVRCRELKMNRGCIMIDNSKSLLQIIFGMSTRNVNVLKRFLREHSLLRMGVVLFNEQENSIIL